MIRYVLTLCCLVGMAGADEPRDGGAAEDANSNAFRFEASKSLWGAACWLTVWPGGRTRIDGTDRRPCIDALDEAVRLARAEDKVNRGMKRRAK